MLQQAPFLYKESDDALQPVPQVSLRDHLVPIKEDGELNVICQIIHPTIAQSLKKIGSKNYPSGGFKPNALDKRPKKKESSP